MTAPNPITQTMAEEIAKECGQKMFHNSVILLFEPDQFQAALNLAVQRAVGEPVAWAMNIRTGNEIDGEIMYRTFVDQPECPNTPKKFGFDTPLYALANTEGE